jgi:zinc carboxypeptidase
MLSSAPVILRALPAFLAVLILGTPGSIRDAHAQDAADVPAYWRTRAERSGYRQTADYDETMRFCRQLEAASRYVKLTSYGLSGQRRELPLVIVSKDRAFTPEQALATGKPVVLIQNGIHAGEIEGKDASLALMRDLTVLGRRAELLDGVILLVLPILSVDGHERRSRWNRINQNGPEEMGWRSTPIGLNLNRDYLKLETPELRALIGGVYTRWWPHLLVDNHTTDGAEYRHDLTYAFNQGPGTPAAVAAWLREAFEGRVVPRLESQGHLTAPYLVFRHGNDPLSGILFEDSRPRYSTGYAPLQCRAGILVETHMHKPYAARVQATYDLMVALLEELTTRPRALVEAVSRAEAEVMARARERDPRRREVVLGTAVADSSVPFRFHGVRTRWETSDLTGATVARYEEAPWDTVVRLYRTLRPALVVRQPVGYLVPQEWTACRDRLDLHGVRYLRLARAWSDTVEVQRIEQWSAAEQSSEGHRPIQVARVALERRLRSFRAGDLWVPLDQRSALVAIHLFEAQAPDGLMYWNAFDTVFEFKEYAEDYVMEPIARRMLAERPELAREFRARVASDSSFARSAQARLDFFYRRSPWADPEQNLHPVARALRAPPADVLTPR